MTAVRKMVALAPALSVLLACQPVVYGGEDECEEPAVSAGGEQGSPDELSELMAEMIAPEICNQARGSFIGLPGDESQEGAAGGQDPSVGRWWIRTCEAQVEEGRLRVSIGGPGWTWLDRESSGFRVRQYLRFQAQATFSASLHVGYDGPTRVASIWLRPAPGVTATVEPTGLVQAEATGVFSSMLGGILDMTGSSASDRARQQASEEGSQRLTERFATGFTVTYALDPQQMDFMLGELARGESPQRPWPQEGRAWMVNERSMVWPGGMDVIGPIAEDAGDLELDAELEGGDGAVLRRVCADDLHTWLDAAWAGRSVGPPRGDQVADVRRTGAPQRVSLPAVSCPSMLVVSPLAQASQPVRMRYRVRAPLTVETGDTAVAAGTPNTPSTPTTRPATPPRPLGRTSYRIQIRGVSVRAQNTEGDAWDMFGGAPDPYVVVSSIAQGRELFRIPAVDDNRELSMEVWLPNNVRPDQLPIRFVVYDEDVAGDEVIGSADLEADALPEGQTDVSLDLRSQGSRAGRTGRIRIRILPQQGR
ncbi:MAG: hypothetical protein AB8I08_39335 [Sandaracinaceae bacterium]